jgi:phospholipid/cholesterol/gamma-HCH transport system ATP-binding protein
MTQPHITVRDLTMAYGSFVLQRDLNFAINRGDIFVVMGGSGCGKSTLLRHLIGLNEPAQGEVLYEEESFTRAGPERRQQLMRRIGVLYQSGALWSSLTLAENVAVPLEEFYPSQISGGMQKRAGLARAMALDPEVLFFDEPSAGLDPLSSRRLDELIVELRDSLGATIVIVTHELPSIFAVGTNSIFLDAETRTMIAMGVPTELRDHSDNPTVRRFLRRGENGHE